MDRKEVKLLLENTTGYFNINYKGVPAINRITVSDNWNFQFYDSYVSLINPKGGLIGELYYEDIVSLDKRRLDANME